MEVLNLANPKSSDINFRVSQFPDGQQQVVIFTDLGGSSNVVQIKSRLNNFKDLELIICASKALRNLGVKEIHLYTPYFLGSRSDRQFEKGSNNYLRDVICPIINSLNFESVTVLDPHSDVLESCLNNFKKEYSLHLYLYSLGQLYKDLSLDKFIIVSPDAGATKKIYKLVEQICC